MLLIMIQHEYGTVEYYSEMFSDILADCGSGDKPRDEKSIRNVMAGFERAICSWLDYHEESSARYRELHRRFLLCDLD